MSETSELVVAVRLRVDDAKYRRDTMLITITLAECEAFIEVYDEWRSHDTYRMPSGEVYGNQRPASPRPYVGMTGHVFGYPCVVVENQHAEVVTTKETK